MADTPKRVSGAGGAQAQRVEDLPDGLVAGLCDRSAYALHPDPVDRVTTIQTHISHLFLTASRVYKVRKAVSLGFLDFGTRAVRNADCLRELTLNRRLAPDVYLGVAPVELAGTEVRVGAVGESVYSSDLEHCVVMRRLPSGRDAVSLIESGEFGANHVDAITRVIVRFHERHRLGRPAPFSPEAWLTAISAPVADNFTPISEVIDDARLPRLARRTRDFLDTYRDRFETRRVEGRAVDGHGDLHLAHVWFEAGETDPLLIDCIEFSDRLRHIDAASEVAFMAMDLRYRGHDDLADRFLRRYAAASDDFHLYSVVDYFLSYRAAVRAKVAAIAAVEVELPDAQRRTAQASANRHLDLAGDALFTRGRGAVVATAGVVGTGKSTAAEVVANGLDGTAVISSDRVRKRLVGLDPLDRTGDAVDQGIYSEDVTQRVYRGLLDRAEAVIGSGRVAVLDATFSSPNRRAGAAGFARAHGVPFLMIETRCGETRVRHRLEDRERRGVDTSDAGPAFYAASVSRYVPVRVHEGKHLVVDTDVPSWQFDLEKQVQAWHRRSTHDGST